MLARAHPSLRETAPHPWPCCCKDQCHSPHPAPSPSPVQISPRKSASFHRAWFRKADQTVVLKSWIDKHREMGWAERSGALKVARDGGWAMTAQPCESCREAEGASGSRGWSSCADRSGDATGETQSLGRHVEWVGPVIPPSCSSFSPLPHVSLHKIPFS